MAKNENKTQITEASVEGFIDKVEDKKRKPTALDFWR